ncbi:winged helix-turn-helix domain-containing protein [Streptomyces sp. ME01-18a]|uniref:ArsR/SmtB family transcription factor n=1 Tax=Streptomyces sp. ME01-18a TaxID=3028669 RepID=UPI0029B1B724|nr:winged helix-turn-helix domain-containing protein [Streptomyces sp. ME01-18a]MDX3433941.1 winged helix-turn-helix domain-containing protein [Streptomyces sp. ME01-18a]
MVGPHRAQVLRALAVPATTTQMVRQLGLSLGAVGGHLAVLRESGLVTRTRTCRSVRYERAPLGGTLAGD